MGIYLSEFTPFLEKISKSIIKSSTAIPLFTLIATAILIIKELIMWAANRLFKKEQRRIGKEEGRKEVEAKAEAEINKLKAEKKK